MISPGSTPAAVRPDVYRRRVWSRTDSARWLNAQTSAVLAWAAKKLRVKFVGKQRAPMQAGYWLQEKFPAQFDVMHGRLVQAAGAGQTPQWEDVQP